MSKYLSEIEAAAMGRFASSMGTFHTALESAETPVAIFTLDSFECEIWVEHERDVRLQLVPIARRMKFPDSHKLLVQADRVGGQVFSGTSNEVRADMFGPGYTEPGLARNSDIKQRGMHLLDLTFVDLYKRVGAIDRVMAFIKQLDEIMQGKFPPW